MKRWVVRACQKDVDDSELRKLCGSSFQVVCTVKEKDVWLKVLVEIYTGNDDDDDDDDDDCPLIMCQKNSMHSIVVVVVIVMLVAQGRRDVKISK